MSYTVKDANKNQVIFASKTKNGEECPEHCTSPTGSINNYLSRFAEDPADSSNEDANKDYSTVPTYFQIKPPVGEIWYIARMLPYIQDTGSFDSGGYGNSAALPNGIEIKVYTGEVEQIALTNSQPIKQNTHWKKFCYDITPSSFGSGDESLGARWTFTNGGTFIKLDGDLDQSIRVELSDDFSFLTSHTFLFQGYIE